MSRAAAIAIALAATGVYFHEPSRKFATHLVNGVTSAMPKSSASNKIEAFQPEANEDFDDEAARKKKKPTTNDAANKPSAGGPNLNPVFPIKGHMFAIVTNGKDNKIHGLWPDFQSDPPKRAAPSCTLNPSSLTSDERNWVMSNYMDNGKGQMSMFSHEWNQHGCYGWKDVSTFIAATKVAFDAAKQGGNCAKCGKNGDYYQCYTPCSSLTSCKPGACKSKWNIKKQKKPASDSFADDASKRKKAGDGSGCANAPSDTVLALVTNGQGVRLHGWWPGWGESYQWSDIDTSTLTAAQVATINSLYMPNNQGPLGMFRHEWKCHGSRYFADVDSFLAASQTALQTATKAGNCASTCNQDGDWHDCRVPCTDANTCSASKSCSASSWTPAPDDFNADGARKAVAAPAAPTAAAVDGFDDNAAKKKKKPARAAASSQPPLVVAWLTNSDDQPKLHGMWPNYPPGQDNVGECCSESNTWNCALPQVSDDDRQYIMDNWLSPSNPKQNQMDMFGHEWWTHGCEGYADTASFLKDVRVAFASAQQATSNCDYNQQVYQDCDSINDCSQYTGVCKSYWKQPGN